MPSLMYKLEIMTDYPLSPAIIILYILKYYNIFPTRRVELTFLPFIHKSLKNTLKKVLDYTQNLDKTDVKTLVSSFRCTMKRQILSSEITLSQDIDR